MTNEDKKYLIEKVGLPVHKIVRMWSAEKSQDGFVTIYHAECSCGDTGTEKWIKENHPNNNKYFNQLDPLDPADMYGKIIPAIKKITPSPFMAFTIWLLKKYGQMDAMNIQISAPDLAQTMLEYFKSREEGEE